MSDIQIERRNTMIKETVHAVDMSDRLNAEGKYLMKVRGKEFCNGETAQKDCILDLSELNIDQIGVIAGFLDAAFDGCGLDSISGVSIVKSEEIEEETNMDVEKYLQARLDFIRRNSIYGLCRKDFEEE